MRDALKAGAAMACALIVAGCGSASDDAGKLLRQTFSGHHTISSGLLQVELIIDPGPHASHGPITLSFGGPFQSLGAGRLPESDFNIGLGGPGFGGSIGIVSTGTAGYVTLRDVGYQLPEPSYQRLESSFAGAAGPSASGIFSRLQSALTNPRVVGDENIGGANTVHIRAGVEMPVVLDDLSTILRRASRLGVSGTSRLAGGLSAATQRRLASEIRAPSFDLWTGVHDKTLRRLALGVTLPASGQIAQLLGSSSLDLDLSIQYSQLNKPQAISAPSTVRPFGEFVPRLRAMVASLEATLVAGQLPAASATATSGTSTSNDSSAAVLRYSECVNAAGSDVTKMQKCAPLLSGS